MADNVTADPGSGGAVLATDDVGGVHYPYAKLAFGAADVATIVSASDPFPVDITSATIDVMLGTDFSNVFGTANIVATVGSGVLTLGLHSLGSDGTNARILRTDTDGHPQVDVLTQPARAATTDNIAAALMTNVIHDGTTALTPKFAVIDDAVSGDNTLVAAVAGKKIRVLAAFLVSAGTVNARFEDGAAGTALTGQMNLVANSGFTLPFNPAGWFETSANTLLNLELSAAVSVDGCLVYVEV